MSLPVYQMKTGVDTSCGVFFFNQISGGIHLEHQSLIMSIFSLYNKHCVSAIAVHSFAPWMVLFEVALLTLVRS